MVKPFQSTRGKVFYSEGEPQRTQKRVFFGEEEVYVPREDRNWTPDTPVTRFRVAGQARVTATELRLRKEPISGDVILAMPKGAIVSIGPSNTAGWAYVEYAGSYGFASNEYLEPVGGPDWDVNPVVPPPPAPAPPQPRPAPAPPPTPPSPQGSGVFAKLAVALLVVTVIGVPTYMLLKPKGSYA
jgi:hypothetical protein